MARAKKGNSKPEMTKTVNDATAAATGNVLRLAAEVGNGPCTAEQAASIAELARMCEEAANHMARAQDRLINGADGGEAAIDHLDAALQCLNELAAAGERHVAEQEREAQSA